jgi:exopolysaccharide production protein ExoZ
VASGPDAGRRFEGLQELRLLAAVAVLAFHTGHFVGLNDPAATPLVRFWEKSIFSMGVNLFFGISGFVLMHALTRTPVPQFLVLRFLRIYPPFLAAVALTYLTHRWFLGEIIPVSPASLTLLPLGPMQYPLLVQWSLVYEIFYYVVVAVGALLPRPAFRWALWLWSAALIAGAVLGLKTSVFPTFLSIWYSLFNLCFIGGILAYEHRELLARRWWAVAAAGLAAIVGAHPLDNSLRHLVLMPVATTALVSLMARDAAAPRSRWRRFLARGGDWSYGLYLVHVPVITLLLGLGLGALTAARPGAVFLLVGATTLVTGLLYGGIELAVYRRARRIVRSTGRVAARPAASGA